MAGAVDDRAQLISNLMKQEGPVVKVVALRVGGRTEELNMDMTPKKNELATFLGGPATFVGQFPELDVMVLKRRAPEGLEESKHRLQPPLHNLNETVHGDMLLVRMDENAEPQDFALDEYTQFAAREITAAAEASSSAAGGGEAGAASTTDEEKTDDDEAKQAMLFKICDAFRGEFNREPTVDEIKGILRRLQGLQQAEAEASDNDDDEDEDEEEDSDDEDFAPDGMDIDDVDEVEPDEEHLED